MDAVATNQAEQKRHNKRRKTHPKDAFFTENLDLPVRNLTAEFRSVRDRTASRVLRNTVMAGATMGAVYPAIQGVVNPALHELGDKTSELTEQVMALSENLDLAGLANEAAGLRESVNALVTELADPNAVAEGAGVTAEAIAALGGDVGLKKVLVLIQ